MKPENVLREDDEYWYVEPKSRNDPECAEILKAIKLWEKSFVQKNGRKPGRIDIFAAPDEVEAMYDRYWSMVKGKIRKKHDASNENNDKDTNPCVLDGKFEK